MADDTGAASMAALASAAATDVSTAASAREGVVAGSKHAYVARSKTAEEDTATRDAEGQKKRADAEGSFSFTVTILAQAMCSQCPYGHN